MALYSIVGGAYRFFRVAMDLYMYLDPAPPFAIVSRAGSSSLSRTRSPYRRQYRSGASDGYAAESTACPPLSYQF